MAADDYETGWKMSREDVTENYATSNNLTSFLTAPRVSG